MALLVIAQLDACHRLTDGEGCMLCCPPQHRPNSGHVDWTGDHTTICAKKSLMHASTHVSSALSSYRKMVSTQRDTGMHWVQAMRSFTSHAVLGAEVASHVGKWVTDIFCIMAGSVT